MVHHRKPEPNIIQSIWAMPLDLWRCNTIIIVLSHEPVLKRCGIINTLTIESREWGGVVLPIFTGAWQWWIVNKYYLQSIKIQVFYELVHAVGSTNPDRHKAMHMNSQRRGTDMLKNEMPLIYLLTIQSNKNGALREKWTVHVLRMALSCNLLPFADRKCVMCHAKTGLKILVVVVPKESLADTNPTKLSFGMTSSIKV